MKLNRFGALSALVVAAAAVGCSSTEKHDKGAAGEGAIAFKLTTADGLVDFTSVHYELTQGAPPVAVLNDDIPVPRPESTITLGIQSLAFGTGYGLSFAADGVYHNPVTHMDQPTHCASEPHPTFDITSTSTVTLPVYTLSCHVVGGQTDNTGGVNADVNVQVVQDTVNNIVETFSYGPRSVRGYVDSGSACAFPPIALKVENTDAAITYAWSDNDAASNDSLAFTGTPVDGEYHCASGGTKILTLTATKGAASSSKQVSVVCDDAPCGFTCGNNTREGSEQCDSAASNCVACQIVPTCGDGIVDGPSGICSSGVADPDCQEACDPLTDTTCDSMCHIIPPVTCGNNVIEPALGEQCDPPNATTCDTACHLIPTCGDGIVDSGLGETCDNGSGNSDTIPGACRTNCHVASCGDNVVDPSEQCEPPNTATCTATCQTAVVTPPTQWATCDTCISGDPDTNEIQQFFCTSTGCQDVEACIINSGCYFPNPTDCYCGEGANLDTCLQPSATVPPGACAALYRAATGNLLTGSGQIDNAATLDASTLTTNSAGQAQAVIANVADPGHVCFGSCGFP